MTEIVIFVFGVALGIIVHLVWMTIASEAAQAILVGQMVMFENNDHKAEVGRVVGETEPNFFIQINDDKIAVRRKYDVARFTPDKN